VVQLAAKQGNAVAQYLLGEMYDTGHGAPQNDKTAVKWYKLAAEQGDADAQSNLGLMYRKGQGVPQDYKTAVKWYRLAAEQGMPMPSTIWV
jgi:TPR repeat protein